MPSATEVEPLAALKKFCEQYETQKEAAAAFGVTAQYLSDVLKGRRPISDKILYPLGLKRAVIKVR